MRATPQATEYFYIRSRSRAILHSSQYSARLFRLLQLNWEAPLKMVAEEVASEGRQLLYASHEMMARAKYMGGKTHASGLAIRCTQVVVRHVHWTFKSQTTNVQRKFS